MTMKYHSVPSIAKGAFMSPDAIRKVNVIGHLNPDTDSICSAIA